MITMTDNRANISPVEPDDRIGSMPANGIQWVLEDDARRQKLASQARAKAENEYTLDGQATNYKKLYESVMMG